MRRLNISLVIGKSRDTRLWLSFLLIFIVPALSQGAGPYKIGSYTIDGGGGTSSSGTYTLSGTIGQPDADVSDGGGYELLGGFWPSGYLYIVDFNEFARFADGWLETGSGLPADLDGDYDVDMDDLSRLADYWLMSV